MSRALVALATLVATLVLAGPAAAQDSSEPMVIRSFDVTIGVGADGVLEVQEEIAVTFLASRRGIFRTIPVRYPYDDTHERIIRLDDITVETSGGAPDDVELTDSYGDKVIRIGDEDTYLDPGDYTYRIRYRVTGALNSFPDHEEVYWNATGTEWGAPIEEATVTLAGPPVREVACFAGPLGSNSPCAEAEIRDGGAGYRAEDLAPGSGLTVVATFAPGSVATEVLLDEIWSPLRAFSATPATLGGAGVVAAVLAALLFLGARRGRDETREDPGAAGAAGATAGNGHRTGGDAPVVVEYRPPDGLRPAQLGVLVDERVDPHDVSATIVDLAVRGHLTIEEEAKGGLFGKTDWILRRQLGTDRPAEWEEQLLDDIFASGLERRLSALKGTFATQYQAFCSALYDDAVANGWYVRRPDKVRALWIGLGVVGLLGSIFVVIVAAATTHAALVVLPLVPAAIALLVLAGKMPRRTAKGSALLRRTLGFRRFVAAAEQPRMEFAEAQRLFVAGLPYAVMYGVVDRWAWTFSGLGAVPPAHGGGAWYYSAHGVPDITRLSSGLSDFSSRAGTGLATRPASSGGSGISGGSSGGGFGGGGGGSW